MVWSRKQRPPLAFDCGLGEIMAISEALDGTDIGRSAAGSNDLAGVSIEVHHALDAVADVWRQLASGGVVSPGQSLDFIRNWIESQRIAPSRQVFVLARLYGRPLALLPLLRTRKYGLRMLSWFPGGHVGCNAPLVDAERVASLEPWERRALWGAVIRALPAADLVFLPHVPETLGGRTGLLEGMGAAMGVETLYRAQFSSWQEADSTQRNKSRRKHDRQQGDRLAAFGTIDFQEIGNSPESTAVLDVMFRQRAARFRQMGVRDPFADEKVRRFYYELAGAGSPAAIRLHVLRLEGEIVAVRYSVAIGDTLYCLISSMSDAAELRPGSPGKQCLLRVMQTVFDQGWGCFDMGAGCTDEKRHWCNVLTPLNNHYAALTLGGRLALGLQSRWHQARALIKANPTLLAVAKRLRAAATSLRTGKARQPASE